MATALTQGSPLVSASAEVLDAERLSTTELNETVRELAAQGRDMRIVNPAARHHLVIGVLEPVNIEIEGTAGYFAASLLDGPNVRITGSAGWSLADNLMQGLVVVERNASAFAGPGIRGGTLVIRGSAGNRLGQVTKAGTIVVGGDAGFMAGSMLIDGTIIILGGAGADCGEHIVAGRIFVGGSVRTLGEDAVETDFTDDDLVEVNALLAPFGMEGHANMKKIVSGGRLHHYKAREF
jgi:methylamine---glutamate N-methyltransferase subunit B